MDRAAERARLRTARKLFVSTLGDAAVRAAGAALAELAAPHLACFKIIGSYWAMGSELNPAPLEARLRAAGHVIALPVVTDAQMPLRFARHDVGDAMETGPIGAIPQPAGGAKMVQPDALLVPLLGVDRRGFRLGQGAGFYDRTIAALAPEFTLGLAYDCQIVEHIQDAPWDEPLNAIATPTQFIRALR